MHFEAVAKDAEVDGHTSEEKCRQLSISDGGCIRDILKFCKLENDILSLSL